MTIHYSDPDVTLHHGDCIEVMRELPDASVDAVVTDPPYLLGFMGRQWDTKAAHEHLDWHRAWVDECLRLLKPGGYLLAFGGTRTWHRLACAVEDAGFEVRDTIAWLHGQGFPKGAHQLKPAFEPVVVARKTGATGTINIDACRVAAGQDYRDKCASVVGLDSNRNGDCYGEMRGARVDSAHEAGRWPTNVVLDSTTAAAVDGQSGYSAGKRMVKSRPGSVLEPFAGSGTTAEAAVLEGAQCIAIEREVDYLPLITQRLSKPLQVGFEMEGLM